MGVSTTVPHPDRRASVGGPGSAGSSGLPVRDHDQKGCFAMRTGSSPPHRYLGRKAALATKHQKERVLEPPLRAAVGLTVCVPDDLDTDQLGTFSGEVERPGTPREVALRKARWGMRTADLPLGMASEGSFGPDPRLPFASADFELLAFIDDELGIQVVEQVLSSHTNFGVETGHTLDEVQDFLARAQFPSHGLVVRPNSGLEPGFVFKGITTVDALREAFDRSVAVSADGLAHIETDMRAHMNPTRRKVLREAAVKLGRRLATLCPQCRSPGWGRVDVVRGLPCEWCGRETELVRLEVQGCPRCEHRIAAPRRDGLLKAPADNCAWCNP